MKTHRLLLNVAISAVLSLAALASLAQQAASPAPGAPRLTIEDLLRWRIPSNPVLSPDGRRVAFLVTENDFEKSRVVVHLWWADVESRQARRLTHTDDAVSSPRWSPDGRHLAFLSTRGAAADGRPRAQVWLLPVDGGEPFALTRTQRGVRHFRWAPDGRAVYYVTDETVPPALEKLRERRREQRLDAYTVDEEKLRREIWRVTVEGRRAERVFAGDLGLDSFELSPDARWIVYRSNGTGDPDHLRRYDLWLLDVAAGRARQLVKRDGAESSMAWSPDSTRIAFLAPRDPRINSSQDEVFIVPVAAPAGAALPEPQQATRNFSGDIEHLHWTKGDAIYFSAGVRTGNQLFRLNPADGVTRALTPDTAFLADAHWRNDDAVAIAEGPAALPDVVVVRSGLAGLETVALTDLNPQLKTFALGAQEVVRWKSKDGMEIEGVLIKPPGWTPGARAPLLVDIHGGPHSRRANTLAGVGYAQAWAARGWLVFHPNFRGSSAYGHEFGIANQRDIGGRDAEDILTGVDFLVAQGLADEDRMAVLGGSYGGYMTNWLIARTKRFRAAASLYGIFNLITDFSQSDFPSWEPNYLSAYYWDNLDIYIERSPFRYVKDITTPVLIMHGDDDNNTFVANSREMYQALKILGRTARFVRFPREGHGFREPNHRVQQFQLMAAWMAEHALGSAGERPRLPVEAVRSGPWELRVTGVRTPESYSGVRPRGYFVEVEILVRAVTTTTDRLALLVFDNAGGEIQLDTAERPVFPAGIVAESLGQRTLVRSQGQVLSLEPDRDGAHTALAATIAFDAPANARSFLLRVKDFPPIRIELPLEK